MATQAPVAATYVSFQQAADIMSCSVKTIRRRIAAGELPARRIGARMIRIEANDLDLLGRNLTVPRA